MRPRFAIAACLLALALRSPFADAEPSPAVAPDAPVATVATYGGPTTDTRAVIGAAVRAGLAQLADFYEWASQQPHPPRRYATGNASAHHGYATAKECVAMDENHGDYGRSTNPTHFGRYQFSVGTWAAYGGNPDTWGTASPAEQDAVFETAWASPGGPSNWLPYDGC